MKKFNEKIIVFILCILFILFGYNWSCIKKLAVETKEQIKGNDNSLTQYTSNVEGLLSDKISYHDNLMDINSIKNNMLGIRIIQKEDKTVIKTNDANFAEAYEIKPDKNEIALKIDERILKYKIIADDNDAGFLCVNVPSKALFEGFPPNVENHSLEEYNSYLRIEEEKEIPILNLFDLFNNEGLATSESYFSTDHHWTPKIGFEVNKWICQDLNDRYDFQYNTQHTDIANYDVLTYKNQFLGSYGRKVGTFFSWKGPDDFDLITPKFETSFTEEQPYKDEIRTGSFKETLLFMDNMEKDYYRVNTYCTYSGGDFRLQIMRNHLNPEGKKIVLIRNSYGCVVAPFLALQTSELHVMDVRDGEEYVGEVVDVEEYVKTIHADYVIVII